MSKRVKKFIRYFHGMETRVPIYEDGTAGKPETISRFTKVNNEDELEEYEVVTKKDEQPDEEEQPAAQLDIDVEEETYL